MRGPRSNTLKRSAAAVLVAAAGVGLARCGQAILTAPAGSTLHITANPPFIQAQGGVSVISVIVIEPTGTVVPDGTVVQFFTTLGRIDEQGKTNDGVARVNLQATGLSGMATVTAVSGGPAPAPSTPTTSTTTTTTVRPAPLPSSSPRATFGAAAGEGQASLTVAIGTAVPTRIVVSADPARVTQQRPARIVAIVLDANGNPVANVPVFFTLRVPTTTERLDSGGDPLFTDTNGMADDVLRTSALPGATPRSVTVDATTATGTTNAVVVGVN